jgi:hypothetical protein
MLPSSGIRLGYLGNLKSKMCICGMNKFQDDLWARLNLFGARIIHMTYFVIIYLGSNRTCPGLVKTMRSKTT